MEIDRHRCWHLFHCLPRYRIFITRGYYIVASSCHFFQRPSSVLNIIEVYEKSFTLKRRRCLSSWHTSRTRAKAIPLGLSVHSGDSPYGKRLSQNKSFRAPSCRWWLGVFVWKVHITRRSRGILNAWHFQFDSALVFTAQWFRLGGGVVHPLTRRYTAISHLTFSWLYGKHRYVRAFQLLGR